MTLNQVVHTKIDKQGRKVTEKLRVKMPESYPRQLVDWADLRKLEKVAILRDGHLGDLVMLTGALRCLRTLCPDTTFDLYCADEYTPLFYGSSHVVRASVEFDKRGYQEVVDVRSFPERSPDAWFIDRVSLFGRAFGISVWEGYPELYIDPAGKAAAREMLKTIGITDNNFVVIGPDASDPCRCLTDKFIEDLQSKLMDKNIPSIVVGSVRGLRLSVPALVALIHESLAVVCGDNALYHIAGAFRTLVSSYPIMTTVDPALRCKWYKLCRPVVPATPCAPCNEKRTLPTGKDCLGICMNAVDPASIVKHIEAIP